MAEQAQKPGVSRGLKWALGVSLALNLLVIGAIGGAALRHMGEGPKRWDRGAPPLQSYGAPYMRALPPEARKIFNEALRSGMRALPSRAERQANFAQMIALLRQDPIDLAAIEAQFAKQREAAIAVQSTAQAHWLKVVSEMSVQERATLADRLEKALQRGPGKKK